MRVTIDLMKKSTQIIDLSNVINPRVGDDDLLLPLHICYGDNLYDMRENDVEFLTQDTNKNNIYIAGTCNTNTPGDNLYTGDLTFRFPAGTFKVDGTYDPDQTMFRIVDKATQKVISSVNVKITVMKNAIEFNFDPGQSSYDSRAETMLQDFHDKGQAMLDEITDLNNQAKSNVSGDTATTANAAKQQADQNTGDISDLKGEVAGARGRFTDLPGREDAQDTAISQKETIVNANANYALLQQKDAQQDAILTQKAGKFELEDKLAQMKLTPEGFANLDDLKAKYPNGNPGLNVTVDDGHLYIWYDNAWKDCGQFQTAGLDKQALEPIKELLAQYGQAISLNTTQTSILQDIQGMHEGRLTKEEAKSINHETRLQAVEGTGSLKTVYITDQDGNHITDNDTWISGQRWLIDTDKTLTQEDMPADAKAVGEALVTKPENYDIPILYLYGAGIEGMQSKKDSVSVGLSYKFPRFNLSGTLNKIKVQGSSSASLPKKNYTLQLDQAVELINGYGKQKKYVIKADMTDFSHARNGGCAELWGKVRQTRVKPDDVVKVNDTDYLVDNAGNHIVGEADPQLSIGGTYGSVDGFPIAVYINDKYWGLYTFNIPKDKGMAKMTEDTGKAIVSTTWMSFTEHTKLDGTDMGLEYCGTKDSTWVTDAVNSLIDVVKVSYNTRDDFTNAVSPYLDLDSAIDYYVYSIAIGNVDGVVRNFNLQTWNGNKWYFAAYDLDMVFGRTPDLMDYLSPEYDGSSIRQGGLTFENMATGNQIFNQLWKFYKDEIIAHYKDLASNILSSANVGTFFTNYVKKIPVTLKIQEDKTWPQTPLTESNNVDQIRWWYMYHINFLNSLVANA